MTVIDVEKMTQEIVRRSRISAVFVVMAGICIIFSMIYYTKKVLDLSASVKELEAKITDKGVQLEQKETELRTSEIHLAEMDRKMLLSTSSLNTLQEATRFLLNRQYAEAIGRFSDYLKSFPESAEALNFLGYAELRYAQYWRENSHRVQPTEQQKKEYINFMKDYAERSELHLRAAIGRLNTYAWPRYNLSLLYFQNGRKRESLDELRTMLAQSPFMVAWLCEDGQFRRMRIDGETSQSFEAIVSEAVKKERRSGCWVTKPPR